VNEIEIFFKIIVSNFIFVILNVFLISFYVISPNTQCNTMYCVIVIDCFYQY